MDWETAGQRALRHQVASLAERWNWSPKDILTMPIRTRLSYFHRMMEFVHMEKQAAKKSSGSARSGRKR